MLDSCPTKSLDLNSLYDFLSGEQYQENADTYENYFKPIHERVENHICIENCVVKQINGDSMAIEYTKNLSRFREGDVLYINTPEVSGENIPKGYEMEWVSSEPSQHSVLLQKTFNSRKKKIPFSVGTKIILDDSGTSMHHAISETLRYSEQNSYHRPLFLSFLNQTLTFESENLDLKLRETISQFFSLTENQQNAFENALKFSPISAIQGPPGTGKTHVLAALACYFIFLGKNVLVSALSHYAINNALNKIAWAFKGLGLKSKSIKISRTKNGELSNEVTIFKNAKEFQNFHATYANVFGMTAFMAKHVLRNASSIDVLILDEASQLTIPLGLMSMSFSKRTFLIGDHCQMKPIINYKHHPQPLYASIFEYFNTHYAKQSFMLTSTFRMNQSLTKSPSALFYQNKLISADISKNRTIQYANDIEPEKEYESVFSPDHSSVFINLEHQFSGNYSWEEALLICDLVTKAVQNYKIDPKEMAVLVPFRAQQEKIRYLLRKQDDLNIHRVLVDTVERMQGQERELIFFGLTISDLTRLSQINEFFFNTERFNVAITRARTKRIIIGSKNLLLTRTNNKKVLKSINTLARFLENEKTIHLSNKKIESLAEKYSIDLQ